MRIGGERGNAFTKNNRARVTANSPTQRPEALVIGELKNLRGSRCGDDRIQKRYAWFLARGRFDRMSWVEKKKRYE